jgi:hypothetical protein
MNNHHRQKSEMPRSLGLVFEAVFYGYEYKLSGMPATCILLVPVQLIDPVIEGSSLHKGKELPDRGLPVESCTAQTISPAIVEEEGRVHSMTDMLSRIKFTCTEYSYGYWKGGLRFKKWESKMENSAAQNSTRTSNL